MAMGHLESFWEPGVTAFDARWREPATPEHVLHVPGAGAGPRGLRSGERASVGRYPPVNTAVAHVLFEYPA